ncbi:MAG: hypothetical protein ACW990_00225 [Promethearchaeota archaeon]
MIIIKDENLIELIGNCKSCGKQECNCQEMINKFNASLEKCNNCEFPIYDGISHNHYRKELFREYMERFDRRMEQRKKRTKLLLIAHSLWILAIAYYLLFGLPTEVYFFGLIVYLCAIIFVSKWYKIEPINLEEIL